MSRTWKDRPWSVQEKEAKRRKGHRWKARGFPWAFGGAWEGIKYQRKLHESSERRRVRDELKQGKEDIAPTRHRNSGKWDLY